MEERKECLGGTGRSGLSFWVGMAALFLALLALCAFAAVWAAAVPLWGNHGLWLAYILFYAGRSLFLAPLHPLPRNARVPRRG